MADTPLWVDYAKLAFEGMKAVAVVVGGAWAFWLFVVQRRFAPQIEFDVDAKLFGPMDSGYVAEYTLTFTNKGLTRPKIRKLSLLVRMIGKNDQLFNRERPRSRLCFQEIPVLNIENLIPPEWEWIFIEPGVTQRWRHSSKVPIDAAYLLVHGAFEYKPDLPHTAEKVIEVKGVEVKTAAS